MPPVKKHLEQPVRSPEKKWYEIERYKGHRPPEKTLFPEKLARANERLKNVKMMD